MRELAECWTNQARNPITGYDELRIRTETRAKYLKRTGKKEPCFIRDLETNNTEQL